MQKVNLFFLQGVSRVSNSMELLLTFLAGDLAKCHTELDIRGLSLIAHSFISLIYSLSISERKNKKNRTSLIVSQQKTYFQVDAKRLVHFLRFEFNYMTINRYLKSLNELLLLVLYIYEIFINPSSDD